MCGPQRWQITIEVSYFQCGNPLLCFYLNQMSPSKGERGRHEFVPIQNISISICWHLLPPALAYIFGSIETLTKERGWR